MLGLWDRVCINVVLFATAPWHACRMAALVHDIDEGRQAKARRAHGFVSLHDEQIRCVMEIERQAVDVDPLLPDSREAVVRLTNEMICQLVVDAQQRRAS